MTARSAWWAAFALLGVLCSGIVLGVAADRLWLHRGGRGGRGMMMGRGPGPMRGPPSPEQRREVSARVARELELSPDQATRIDVILARQFAALDSAYRIVQPRLDSVFTASRAAIDSVLTPAQREKRARLFRERGRFRRGGGPGPDGPRGGPPGPP